MVGVSVERGRWAVDLGGVLVRRKTLTGARCTNTRRPTASGTGRRCAPVPVRPYAWERP